MASVGSVYLNFALWAIALVPAWIVVKEIGVKLGDKKIERESAALPTPVAATKREEDSSSA
jgi:hypothetical protein